MYDGAITRTRTIGGVTELFFITIGLHQGLTLSHYFIPLQMDELANNIQDEVPY